MSSDEKQRQMYYTGVLGPPLYLQPAVGTMVGYLLPNVEVPGVLITDGDRIHDNPVWLKVYVWTGRLSKVE